MRLLMAWMMVIAALLAWVLFWPLGLILTFCLIMIMAYGATQVRR